MYLITTRRGLALSRRRARGLGTISTPVGGSLVYGANTIPINRWPTRWGGNPAPVRPVGPAYPVGSGYGSPNEICPAWGCNGPQPSPITGFPPALPVGPAYPVSPTGPITPPYEPWNPGGGTWIPWNAQPDQSSAQALAVAQNLLATNPSLLSQQQFAMLQAAGLVAGTLPYSSVSQITPTTPALPTLSTGINDPNCVAAGCTGGPYPNCTCATAAPTDIGTTLSQTVAGLPLYLWLIIGGGAAFMFSRSSGRR